MRKVRSFNRVIAIETRCAVALISRNCLEQIALRRVLGIRPPKSGEDTKRKLLVLLVAGGRDRTADLGVMKQVTT